MGRLSKSRRSDLEVSADVDELTTPSGARRNARCPCRTGAAIRGELRTDRRRKRSLTLPIYVVSCSLVSCSTSGSLGTRRAHYQTILTYILTYTRVSVAL